MKQSKNLYFSLVILLLPWGLLAMQPSTESESKKVALPNNSGATEIKTETPVSTIVEGPQLIHWGKASFPSHWGAAPSIQTQDVRKLPAPYEKYYGSSTLYGWIEENLKKDIVSGSSSVKVECGVYPEHWGDVPKAQTKDRRKFPDPWGHCFGSGTVVRWIKRKQGEDASK